ncbi:hypothetical protein DFQ14_101478 [Halopolyspora algeriensis]|uniref:Uncharacterized protein n=1 Tax=Halopolyspora algeriensis TaxID=1500506 RepID=A0A368W1Q5_9ACTN|nr:hypothetical protein DFQ14_101478 [Halopolyspora algeriensis]TQM48221.1 hypothetical protein FHU43_3183 [Halopolyspora algeriensis]
MARFAECSTVPVSRSPIRVSRPQIDVRVEPLPHLEWSLATESSPPTGEAASPESTRRSWIHRAPETRVLTLFRQLDGTASRLPAPWWLTALDRGELPSRAAAFSLEDALHALLTSRPGWAFVPWAAPGEAVYWEYGPSDRTPMTMPTTVVLTDRHPGWVSVVPAHTDTAPARPVPMRSMAELERALPRVEAW